MRIKFVMKLDSNTNYLVRDIYEASYLLCSGCELLGLDNGQGFFYFVFNNKTLCESLQFDYWSGSANVSPKQYAESYKSLKALVFQKNKEQRYE